MNYTLDEYVAFRTEALQKSLSNFKYEYPEKLSKDLVCSYMVVVPFSSPIPKEIRKKLFKIYQEYYKKLFEKAFIEAQKYLGPFNSGKLKWDISGEEEHSFVVDNIMVYVHTCLTGMKLYKKFMDVNLPSFIKSDNVKDIVGEKQLSIFAHFSIKTTDGQHHTLVPTVAFVATKYDEAYPSKLAPISVIEYITEEPKKEETK